ncbi:MAG TPA: hypothetical protein VGG15_07475 [Terriglobales bacterium]
MNLLIDNNDGLGQLDYTAWIDGDHPPFISRKLNGPATMAASLIFADATFHPPVNRARVVLQRGDGLRLFTGYLNVVPEREYLGRGQLPAWRVVLHAVDDSGLLDHNVLPVRTPFASRTAGDALKTLTNDVLPGGFDESGVLDVSSIYQCGIVPQKSWTNHAQELATLARATYRAHDGKLLFQPLGQQSFTISEQDPNFVPTALTLQQPDELHNDVTIVGELEPVTYVRDYFLGSGGTLAFYLSKTPYSKTATTIFEEDYSGTQLGPTLWNVSDANHKVSLGGGKLQLNGGPATISFVEQLELAAGLMMQHGQFTFSAASSGIVGGLYNGTISRANCIAGFDVAPAGSNCALQAIVNGSATGTILNTMPGHRYAFATQLICTEAHRVHTTYLSSTHPAGNGRGGDAVPAALRVVLTVHDVDPENPGTIAAPATVLYDGVLPAAASFATYAPINESSFFARVSFTRLQHIADAEIRSMIPGGQFRTRLNGALADGGECYLSTSGVVEFYAPYPPQLNEEVVVAYRSSAPAMARVQDANSIAQHAKGGDAGRRTYVRHLKTPLAPTSIDCENAASALLDDAVQAAWQGEYQATSNSLSSDVIPGNTVQVSAPSRGAVFNATVREVELQVMSLRDDLSQYKIKFANDAAGPLAFETANITLPTPVAKIFDVNTPSSSLYIASLTAAQITDVIATEITVDAGITPPTGGGIEVRRSDGGWGPSDSGNLAGRFTTQTFVLPRLSRVQGYYFRQYDGSTPAKYSRYSALLHVDYPL